MSRARDARVEQLILDELGGCPLVPAYEVPRRVHPHRPSDFTIENDLLTPSLKLKRRNVEQRYGAALDALYAEPAQEKETAARA